MSPKPLTEFEGSVTIICPKRVQAFLLVLTKWYITDFRLILVPNRELLKDWWYVWGILLPCTASRGEKLNFIEQKHLVKPGEIAIDRCSASLLSYHGLCKWEASLSGLFLCESFLSVCKMTKTVLDCTSILEVSNAWRMSRLLCQKSRFLCIIVS